MVLHPEVILSVKLTKLSKNLEQNRNDLRKIVINRFIKEKAGQGNQENTSKYKYIAESLSSGDRVYLTRPVPLNKGFDFIIHVENCIFMNGKDNPRHSDIIEALKKKKQINSKAYSKLLQALEDVFNCKDPNDIYPKYSKHLSPISKNLSPELILKVVKWLFIEQDIRYWNWSGRYMFMEGIRSI